MQRQKFQKWKKGRVLIKLTILMHPLPYYDMKLVEGDVNAQIG